LDHRRAIVERLYAVESDPDVILLR
jgi:hypothetical protein